MKVFALVLGLFVIGTVGIVFSQHIAAQATPERQLAISPLRTEISLEEGTTKTGTLTVYNTGKEALSIQMNTQRFSVTDNVYDYVFDENASANQWVRYTPANFSLDPGKSQAITYTLAVPVTADPGDTYLALFASAAPSAADEVSTAERVASLLYVTVPGDINRQGKLLDLRSPLVTTGDTDWGATIQNSGNSLFRSTYSSTLKTLWGQPLESFENTSTILSSSVRLVSGELRMPQWLGIYKIEYSVGIGDSGTAAQTRYILYLPVFQVIILLGLIAIIVFMRYTRISQAKHKKTKEASSSSEE